MRHIILYIKHTKKIAHKIRKTTKKFYNNDVQQNLYKKEKNLFYRQCLSAIQFNQFMQFTHISFSYRLAVECRLRDPNKDHATR